jgi:cellulose synthase/poly-beta-1,6-N-acetylglucosamine synthase-like glycosyltransferase
MTTYLIAVPYLTVLLVLVFYGLHRSALVWKLWKHRAELPPAAPRNVPDAELPYVTVQLPLFNEPDVARAPARGRRAASTTRASKLEIQVLDDSTDDTRHLARAKVESSRPRHRRGLHPPRRPHGLQGRRPRQRPLAGQGRADRHLRRRLRPAAALPPLGRAHFADAKVGCVQARWGHLNREALAPHARAGPHARRPPHGREPRALRRGALLQLLGHRRHLAPRGHRAAGGWQHDTLTEDLDLSYRAQLAGWKFVYRVDHVTPAELPEEMEAFRAQQFRWAKGTVQTARKLLKRVCSRKDLPFNVRRSRRLPHDAALRVPAHGAARGAAPADAPRDARERPATRCCSSTSR